MVRFFAVEDNHAADEEAGESNDTKGDKKRLVAFLNFASSGNGDVVTIFLLG